MGPWGRIFPRGTPGRCIRAPGPPICGFWALSGGTWPDPRLGTPRSPSGRIFAPRTHGGSGRAVRAPGGRIRPESTCFPVAPGRLRGPEIPHSGPAPGAPGAAGPERAPGDQYLANLSTPRITRWPLVVVIPPSVLYKLVKTPFTLGHHAYSAPSDSGPRTIGHRWHKASGQACIFIEMRKCRRVFRMHFAHRPCITSIRKYARLARKGRQELRHQAPLCLVHCCVI